MANEQNLVKGGEAHTLTAEEASKGGKRSGEVRREKADLRRQMQMWLDSEVTTDKRGNPLTGTQLMVNVAVKEMSKGNSKFWELIRDTAGFKPVDKVMIADVDAEVISEVEDIVKGCLNDSEDDA